MALGSPRRTELELRNVFQVVGNNFFEMGLKLGILIGSMKLQSCI